MNSALIIRGGAIGDFILTLPSIHAFRDHFPETRLEIMGYPHIAELAHRRFYTQAIRSLDHRSVAGFFAHKGELDRELSDYFSSFDLIVSFLYDPDSIFLGNLKRANVPQVIVAESRVIQKCHATEYFAEWLSEAGVKTKIQPPKIYPSEADQKEALRLLPAGEKPFVAIHPGSGSPSKNWPVERFLELVAWLKENGFRVLVLDGPADLDVQTQFWKSPFSGDCLRFHHLPLPVVAAILKKCRAFVGHDSGISHLCAAVGTPVVSVFGPTDPKIWAPRGDHVTILQRGMGVSGVSLQDVKTALEPFLKK